MRDTLAKSLFQRLGGKVAQSVRRPEREVWVLRKPSPRTPLTTMSAVQRHKNLWKAFRMARDLMVEQTKRNAQLWNRTLSADG